MWCVWVPVMCVRTCVFLCRWAVPLNIVFMGKEIPNFMTRSNSSTSNMKVDEFSHGSCLDRSLHPQIHCRPLNLAVVGVESELGKIVWNWTQWHSTIETRCVCYTLSILLAPEILCRPKPQRSVQHVNIWCKKGSAAPLLTTHQHEQHTSCSFTLARSLGPLLQSWTVSQWWFPTRYQINYWYVTRSKNIAHT